MSDWNAKVIEEFRQNHGRVGGPFEGAPMVLVHHVGRRTGAERVTPLVFLPDQRDADVLYIFGSKAGAPEHPQWYRNLVAAGRASVEVGDEAYDVTVTELEGEERDRRFNEQVERMPGFGEYAQKTAGIRTIPVLALRRER